MYQGQAKNSEEHSRAMDLETGEENTSNLQELMTSIVGNWLEKYETNTFLNSDVWNHCHNWIDKAFSPTHGINFANQDIIDIIILKSFEDFIFGKDKEKIENLIKSNKMSPVCGKLFERGEVVFYCVSCAIDPSCVFCHNCFINSGHRYHNYKFVSSCGGGSCDCGDNEAWRCEPLCRVHLDALESLKLHDSLSSDVISRARIIFSSVLLYCFKFTCIPDEHHQKFELPEVLNHIKIDSREENMFCVVHYSDNAQHTNESIDLLNFISSLNIPVTRYDAEIGRIIVKFSSYNDCVKTVKELKDRQPLLNIHVYPWIFESHQELALKLLFWLVKFTKKIQCLRNIFTTEALNLDNQSKSLVLIDQQKVSIAKGILLHNYAIWKTVQNVWCNVFVTGMLLDYTNKLAVADLILGLYPIICEHSFVCDNNLVDNISLQIFTVPSIAYHLISNKNVLNLFFSTFRTEYCKLCVPLKNWSAKHKILKDINLVLRSSPKDWSPQLHETFISGVSIFLNILIDIQNENSLMQILSDIFFMSEVKIQKLLMSVEELIVEWSRSNLEVLLTIFKMVLEEFYKFNKEHLSFVNSSKEIILAGCKIKCKEYVSSKSIPWMLPIPRFFTQLYLQLLEFSYDFNSLEFEKNSKPGPEDILELILELYISIVKKSKGIKLSAGANIISNFYTCSIYTSCYLGKDINLLQVCSTVFDNNSFIIQMLKKFALLDWANEMYDPTLLNNDQIKDMISNSEEFLFLLIMIIGERHTPGIGKVSIIDCAKYELMHQLFIKPHTHSQLEYILQSKSFDCNEINMDYILNDIAIFEKCSKGLTGIYKVKKDLISKYNIFFYQYSKKDKQDSEEQIRKLKEGSNGVNIFFPPPHLCELNAPFRSLASILKCEIMLHIMSLVLKRSLSPSTKLFSELLLHQVLHLIGYALQEKVDDTYLNFVHSSQRWQIEYNLCQLLKTEHAEAHKELVIWLLEKYRLILKEINPEADGKMDLCKQIYYNPVHEQQEFRTRASIRKANLMAQMASLQLSFYNNNMEFISVIDNDNVEHDDSRRTKPLKKFCIICQTEENISSQGPLMILVAFAQKSFIFHNNTEIKLQSSILKAPRTYINSCGHTMHYACWKTYQESNQKKSHIKTQSSSDFEMYLCPLCRSLCNTTLPLLPVHYETTIDISFEEWLEKLYGELKAGIGNCSRNLDDCDEKVHCTLKNEGELNIEQIEIDLEEKSCHLKKDEIFNNIISSFDGIIPTEFSTVIGLFLLSTFSLTNFNFLSSGIALTTALCCAYEIRSLEAYFRHSNKSMFKMLSSQQETVLSNLVNLSTICSVHAIPSVQLTGKLANEEIIKCLLNPAIYRSTFLYWDSFQVLVCLIFTNHNYQNKNFGQGITFNQNLFKLSLLLRFAQIIVFSKEDMNYKISGTEDENRSTECLETITKLFKDSESINTSRVWNLLKKESMPFLKCCALLYHCVSGTELSDALKEDGGATFENILSYLKTPFHCKDLFGKAKVLNLYKAWSEDPCFKEVKHQGAMRHKFFQINDSYRKFIDLPNDYIDTIEMFNSFQHCKCLIKGDSCPALCLLCGQMICSNENFLDNVKEKVFLEHTEECGGGSCAFLLRGSRIFLLSIMMNRGIIIPGPYFNVYGETGEGHVLGLPLKLSNEKYLNLELSWLSHNLPEQINLLRQNSTDLTPYEVTLISA